MPHFADTPEAALPRTDSLDPAETCGGITSTGKPCRRGLNSPPTKNGPTSFFCWQHKDQAEGISANSNGNAPNKPADNNRTSIDTMMERLGIEDANNGPSLIHRPQRRRVRRTYCCCFEVGGDGDDLPPARPSQQSVKPQAFVQAVQKKKNKTTNDWVPSSLHPEAASVLKSEIEKPLSNKDEPGYIYVFWLTPKETTTRAPPPAEFLSSLLNRGEDPSISTTPRNLSDAIRAVQDVHAFISKPTNTDPGTIRLKIGRANNVQRRLNEWTRQCSYNLTLIRYYPYTSSHGGNGNGGASPGAAGRKVPYVHRVEHLIHTELGDKRIKDLGKCPECGKEHKEWFEIKAEKEELKRVDECIRRWVAWAESQ